MSLSLTPALQQIRYQGEKVNFQGRLHGQNFTVSQLEVSAFENQPPVKLEGEFTLPLVPDGLPVNGHAVATLSLPQEPSLVDAELEWRDNAGRAVTRSRCSISPGRLLASNLPSAMDAGTGRIRAFR